MMERRELELEPNGSVEALAGFVGGFAAVLQTSAFGAQQGVRAPQQAPQVPNKRVSAQQGSKSPTGGLSVPALFLLNKLAW